MANAGITAVVAAAALKQMQGEDGGILAFWEYLLAILDF
jgi:hypothetical protein